MRRAAKRDDNHREIVRGLRCIPGTLVLDLAAVGFGISDLAVIRKGKTYWLELKDGSKCPSAQKLTQAQVKLHAEFELAGVKVHVVKNLEEAFRAIGV